MAVKERGLFRIIFKAFFDSLTPNNRKPVLMGVDYLGTKYYEVPKIKSIHNKINRYFVPIVKENFEQEIPAEWEAWLRNRRKEPPTEEEVNKNYDMILTKRQKAAEIEEKFAEKGDIKIVPPDQKLPDQHASLNYPVYEEYKQFGKNYKINIKKKSDS